MEDVTKYKWSIIRLSFSMWATFIFLWGEEGVHVKLVNALSLFAQFSDGRHCAVSRIKELSATSRRVCVCGVCVCYTTVFLQV